MPGNPDVILIFLSSREKFIDKLSSPFSHEKGLLFSHLYASK